MLELTLKSRRKIHLDMVVVERTYSGMLEGDPNNPKINENVLKRRESTARKLCNNKEERAVATLGLKDLNLNKELPKYRFTGQFISYDAAHDPKKDASWLTVIWFQQEYSPVMTPANQELALLLDWDKLAEDFEW